MAFMVISILFSLCTVIEYYRLGVSPIGTLTLFAIIAFAAFVASGFIGHAIENHSRVIESSTPPPLLA